MWAFWLGKPQDGIEIPGFIEIKIQDEAKFMGELLDVNV